MAEEIIDEVIDRSGSEDEDFRYVERLIEAEVLRQGVSREKLKKLYLPNKGIKVLPPGVFKGLQNLEDLSLYNNNQIESLEPGVFEGLQNLKTLSLSFNKIGSLEPGVFAGLENLEWLFLWDNRIESLEPGVFEGLQSLQKLLLDNNRIERLEPGVFAGLQNLLELSLSDNEIRGLEPGVFEGLQNLRKLSLGGSPLTFDRSTIGALMQLINYGKLRHFRFKDEELDGVEEISRYFYNLYQPHVGKRIKAANSSRWKD